MVCYCKLLALYGVCDQVRVSFRVVSRNRTLFPLEADLRGAMFDSNVACHKMLTSEWFCLSRAYNSHTIFMSIVVCVKVLSLEASLQQPSLVREKKSEEAKPSYFS